MLMRVKPLFSLLLATVLISGAFGLSSGWAGLLWHKAKPAATAAVAKSTSTKQGAIVPASDSSSLLGELRSFDVMDIEPQNFSATRENVPAEVMEYARAALQTDERLRYGSPAQGLLRFICANHACTRIRAEVTQGYNGPVVWHMESTYEPNVFINVQFLPDSKRFAKRVVGRLAMDYQKALKPLPMKINIKED